MQTIIYYYYVNETACNDQCNSVIYKTTYRNRDNCYVGYFSICFYTTSWNYYVNLSSVTDFVRAIDLKL